VTDWNPERLAARARRRKLIWQTAIVVIGAGLGIALLWRLL
jgi:hypothetical protein